MPISIFDINGWVKKGMKFNKTKDCDLSQSQQTNKLHYSAGPSSGHACYVLKYVGWRCGFVSLGVAIDFWEETAYYCLSWQT
jgi:hypothetical protein